MYAKCQQFKFHDFNSAKIAASYCGDILGKQIDDLKMAGLNIFLGKDGELSIIVKFEAIEELKAYDKHSQELRRDLNSSFNFTEVKYCLISLLPVNTLDVSACSILLRLLLMYP